MEGACAGCREGFKPGDQILRALDQKWHPQHFVCSSCKLQIKGAFASDSDGKAYCPAHVPKTEQRTCAGCGKTIDTVAAYCLRHGPLHPLSSALLVKDLREDSTNQSPTQSQAHPLPHDRKHWHPECVICAVCNKQISNARPREKNGKPVCPSCAVGSVQNIVNARVRGQNV